MRKTSLFVAAAPVIATVFGVWAASPTNAGAPSGIEPFQLMLTANSLPTTEFADYTFVSLRGWANRRQEKRRQKKNASTATFSAPAKGWTRQ
jgi:hypothetical protein